MAQCDHCGAETTLPFTCQFCGGKFCAEHRLPPNHACPNISAWNRKPRPAVGISYSRGGGAVPTGGGYIPETKREQKERPGEGIPWLKVMIAVIAIIILLLVFLGLGGYL
jgi:hypothetical protein